MKKSQFKVVYKTRPIGQSKWSSLKTNIITAKDAGEAKHSVYKTAAQYDLTVSISSITLIKEK